MHIFFEIGLISPKQPDFRPGGSFMNQLLSTNHETLSAFAIGIEVQWLVFQISKTFDKVWQSGFPGMLALFFLFVCLKFGKSYLAFNSFPANFLGVSIFISHT